MSEAKRVYAYFTDIAYLNYHHPDLMDKLRFNGPKYMAGMILDVTDVEAFAGVASLQPYPEDWNGVGFYLHLENMEEGYYD